MTDLTPNPYPLAPAPRGLRVAIYTRVSTKKRKTFKDDNDQTEYQKMLQDTENQAIQLRDFAKEQGWKIMPGCEYSDRARGSALWRKEYERMFADAAKGKFDLVLFWALDRFSREGPLASLVAFKRLADCGVDICSYREQYLRSLGPWRDAIIGIIATVAQVEIERMKERIHAGLAKASAEGRHGGRRVIPLDEARIAQLMAQGESHIAIARTLGAAESTVRRRMKKPSVILAAEALSPWKRTSTVPEQTA